MRRGATLLSPNARALACVQVYTSYRTCCHNVQAAAATVHCGVQSEMQNASCPMQLRWANTFMRAARAFHCDGIYE